MPDTNFQQQISSYDLHESDELGNFVGAKRLRAILNDILGRLGIILEDKQFADANDISFLSRFGGKSCDDTRVTNYLDDVTVEGYPFLNTQSCNQDVKYLFLYLLSQKGQFISYIDLAQVIKNISKSKKELQEHLDGTDLKLVFNRTSVALLDIDFQGEIKSRRTFPKLSRTDKHIENPNREVPAVTRRRNSGIIKNKTSRIETFKPGTQVAKAFSYFKDSIDIEVSIEILKVQFLDIMPYNWGSILHQLKNKLSGENSEYIFETVSRGVYKMSRKQK